MQDLLKPQYKYNSNIKNQSVSNSYFSMLCRDIIKNKYLYLLALPGVLFFIIFNYIPMYGVVIAFKDFTFGSGIWDSPWVGFKHFKSLIDSIYFFRIVKNTFLLSFYDLIWGFPAPIILALLLNEIRNQVFKRTIQTISYLPYFVSMVVICGIIVDFTSMGGTINSVIQFFGGTPSNLLMKPELFSTIYVSTNIWQGIGWGSIIYLAALSSIDPELYSAAEIDGANRWHKMWHITLPGISSTIILMLILRLGSMMSVGFEKIVLLYNAMTYETADVIASFVYRKGLQESNYSFSAAVGLLNAVVNFVFIMVANKASNKYSGGGIW